MIESSGYSRTEECIQRRRSPSDCSGSTRNTLQKSWFILRFNRLSVIQDIEANELALVAAVGVTG